jgi:CubicO group peptidase (beta-lactamase class C family)
VDGHDLARAVEREVTEGPSTAAQVFLAQGDEVLVRESFGRMSRDEGAPPVREDSPFLVASITKPVTATAVTICADRGLVDVDAPVRRYVPEFTGEGRDEVTVRHLLTHSGGLPDMLPENERLRRRNAPLSEFVDRSIETPLLFEPGTEVRYGSMGLNLAGEVVERVTDRPLREFVRREICEPLGMEETFLGAGGRPLPALVQCDVDPEPGDPGHDRWDWNSAYWRDLGAPWGGLHSTAADVGTFLDLFLHGGALGGTRLLSASIAREMISDQTEGLNSPWGLGWGFRDSLDWTYFGEAVSPGTFGHSGATGTVAWADPARDLRFVCLTTTPLDDRDDRFFDRLSEQAVAVVE